MVGSQVLFNVVIAFLLVVLGVALGFIVKGIVMSLLHGVKLDELVSRLHVSELFGSLSVSELLADIAEAAIIIAFTVQALSTLGWHLIAGALETVLYWIPGVLAALFVFMIFYAIGRWVQNRLEEGKGIAHRFAPLVMWVIVFFGAVVALDQVGLNTDLIQQAALIVIFGFALAFALAVGIAVGFGLKDDAQDFIKRFVGAPETRKTTARKAASKTASKKPRTKR